MTSPMSEIMRDIHPSGDQLNKLEVADSFARAACNYDDAAHLQRRIAAELLNDFIAYIDRDKIGTLMDLGCGTGQQLPELRQRLDVNRLIASDIACGMLHYAKSQQRFADLWLCNDAQNLALESNTCDAVISSFALQWCTDLTAAIKEVARVLKPAGYFAATVPGPGTLYELEAAWAQVDNHIHINQFPAFDSVACSLQQAGFVDVQMHRQEIRLHYAKLTELMAELKAIGAHNINTGRNKGLVGRKKLTKLIEAYESYRIPGGKLPATYQVITWMGRVA